MRRNLSMAISVVARDDGLDVPARARAARPAPGGHLQGLLVRPHPGDDLPVHQDSAARVRKRAVTEAQKAPSAPARADAAGQGGVLRVRAGGLRPVQGAVPQQPIAGNVQVGDIPQSLRVQLNDPTKYEVVTQQFEGAPGVATVQDQQKVLSKFFTIIK